LLQQHLINSFRSDVSTIKPCSVAFDNQCFSEKIEIIARSERRALGSEEQSLPAGAEKVIAAGLIDRLRQIESEGD
jgi:hypothetical protein